MPAPALAASVSGKTRRDQASAPVSLDAKEAVDIAQGLDENVFLFVPNLIGEYTCILSRSLSVNYVRWTKMIITRRPIERWHKVSSP